jgi:hypothetical protein
LNTHVIVDGWRGIDLKPVDIDRVLDEMKRVGAVLLQSSDPRQTTIARRIVDQQPVFLFVSKRVWRGCDTPNPISLC